MNLSWMIRRCFATISVLFLCAFDTIEQHDRYGQQITSKTTGFLSLYDSVAIAYIGQNQNGARIFAVAHDQQGAYVQIVTWDSTQSNIEIENNTLYQPGNFRNITGISFDGKHLYVWSKVTSVFVYDCDLDKIDLEGNRVWRNNAVFANDGVNSADCYDSWWFGRGMLLFHHMSNAASGNLYTVYVAPNGTTATDAHWSRANNHRGVCGFNYLDHIFMMRATSNRRAIWLTGPEDSVGRFLWNFNLGTGHTASTNCTTDGRTIYFAD